MYLSEEVHQRFGFPEGNPKNGIAGEVDTFKVNHRKGAGFVPVDGVGLPLGQNHNMVGIGHIIVPLMVIGNLPCLTKGKTKVLAFGDDLLMSFLKGDDETGQDLCDYQFLQRFQTIHLLNLIIAVSLKKSRKIIL
ncbi:MAG: hypothetical protein IIV98_03145 [Aeriscardovia sp.]|nr:hypothetical protein [Aeriscardovia sp.]